MEKIYTVKEAAKILGFSTNTLYKYLENNTIEAARGSGKQTRFRIPHSAIEQYLNTPISELDILKVLSPAEYEKKLLVEQSSPSPENKQLSSRSLPTVTTRILILLTLSLIILDLVINHDFSLINQLIRLGTLAIFILLAYQHGGYQERKKK